MQPSRQGISRAELITVVVVAVVIVGLLLPWIINRRGLSQRSFCELRQIGVSKGLFLHAVESPTFPGYREIQAILPGEKLVETNWVFPVLPYVHPLGSEIADRIKDAKIQELESADDRELLGDSRYRQIYDNFGPRGELAGKKVSDYIVELVCPESGKMPTAELPQPISFIVNCGMPDRKTDQGPLDHLSNGVFFDRVGGSALMSLDYLTNNDGLQETLLLSENLDTGQTFDASENLVGFVWIDSEVDGIADRDPQRLLGINQRASEAKGYALSRPSSFHSGGVNVAFADGSTKFLSEKIDYLAYVQYMTASGYEVKVAGSDDNAKDPYRLSRE